MKKITLKELDGMKERVETKEERDIYEGVADITQKIIALKGLDEIAVNLVIKNVEGKEKYWLLAAGVWKMEDELTEKQREKRKKVVEETEIGQKFKSELKKYWLRFMFSGQDPPRSYYDILLKASYELSSEYTKHTKQFALSVLKEKEEVKQV